MSVRSCLFVVGLLLFALPGCGTSPRTEMPAGEMNMHNLAILLGQFMARHQGRSPKDEEEFKTFLRALPAEQLQRFGGDVDKLFISPRDSQPYVILYAKSAAAMPGMPGPGGSLDRVAAYEQRGADGKRYVAHQTGKVDLVDEAAFQQLVEQ